MATMWRNVTGAASSVWPESLCSCCQKIKLTKVEYQPVNDEDAERKVIQPGNLQTITYRHYTLGELRESANRGNCPCCKLFLGEISVTSYDSEKKCLAVVDLLAGRLVYELETPKATFKSEFEFFADSETSKRTLELMTGQLFLGRNISSNVDTPEGHRIIRGWIATCEERHPQCSRKIGSLPSRILDISEDTPKLIEGGGLEARYIALSHCWGLAPLLTTTSDTLIHRNTKISMSSLPATFADAVKLTRSLDIKYLWIDSLCIIQDSVEDWLSESANMSRYYQDAHLVISALEGPSSHFKLFQPRENLKSVKLSQPHLRLRPLLEPEHTIFSNSTLNSRAWALQERLLATRIIHFSKNEMLWECSTSSERESLIILENPANPDHIILSEDGNFKRIISILKAQSELDIKVAMNTCDKLAAISAIASNFHSITGFTYVAGIWKEDLQSLLWFSSLADVRPDTYQAPSWSWAATKGQVNMRFDSETAIESENDVKCLEIEAVASGPDQFGPVSGGRLKLRARTIEVQYTPPPKGNTRARVAGRHKRQVVHNIPSTTERTDRFELLTVDHSDYIGEAVFDYIEDQPRILLPNEDDFVVCTAVYIQDRLPTQVAKSKTLTFEEKQRHAINWFLLVVRCDDEKEEKWKRIGVLYTFEQRLKVYLKGMVEWVNFKMVRDAVGWTEREMVIV